MEYDTGNTIFILTERMGYAGMALSAIVILLLTGGFVFTSLQGFRILTFADMIGAVWIGRILIRPPIYTTNTSIGR